jgi:hypothetical protein
MKKIHHRILMAQLQACYMIALRHECYQVHFIELAKKIKNELVSRGMPEEMIKRGINKTISK